MKPRPTRACGTPLRRQRGAAAVEFALLATLFLTLVFGVIEVSRLLFVLNTLQEVTRRAAAGAARVYPHDLAAMDKVRTDAVFRTTPGGLVLGAPVTDQHVRIDYLALTRDAGGKLAITPIAAGAIPVCASQNKFICMNDPNAANCIRFVRARICDPAVAADCQAVQSQTLVPLVDLPVRLHKATTITPVETLGYVPGTPPCEPPTP